MIRYKPKEYAIALALALLSSPKKEDRIIKNFMHTLRAHKDFSRWRRVVGVFEKAYRTSRKEKHFEVICACKNKGLEKNIKKAMPSKSTVEFRIDPSLIGGVRIIMNNEILIDGSVGRRIHKLFRI